MAECPPLAPLLTCASSSASSSLFVCPCPSWDNSNYGKATAYQSQCQRFSHSCCSSCCCCTCCCCCSCCCTGCCCCSYCCTKLLLLLLLLINQGNKCNQLNCEKATKTTTTEKKEQGSLRQENYTERIRRHAVGSRQRKVRGESSIGGKGRRWGREGVADISYRFSI